MPPAVIPVLSKSQARNARRKRARLLNSAQNLIQKNHIARVEQQLSDSIKASRKVQGELELATSDNSRLQNIAQTATLDSYIFKRTADNHAVKIVEKDRIIASLSAAKESSP
jgi:hypothetical protein